MEQVYSSQPGSAFAPDYLIRKLYALPHGADFQDGGQHDCQEALRGLIQALHDDLVWHLLRLSYLQSSCIGSPCH